jgi:hypothetical protein
MNTHTKKRLLIALCLFAGLMDATSGSLLMLVPDLALKLMSVSVVSAEALVFIRFIGAFVFSVGCLYLVALVPAVLVNRWAWVSGVLAVTAWVRAVVCVFTTVAIADGALGLAWWSVPVSDGFLALLQVWVIWKGWVPGRD